MNMDAATDRPNFAWSYSKLSAYELCARRYHETQILKAWPEERSAQLDWGDAVHAAMAQALRDGTPLPTKFQIYQKWVDKVVRTEGELLIEDDCRWAVNRKLQPVPWFAKDVWLRTVADAVKLDGNAALVVDWKSGKSSNVDPVQLTLTSLM